MGLSMPWYEGTTEETIGASAEAAFAALTDYEAMPSWQGPLKRCDVEERDADGTPTVVAYEIATPIRAVSYRLRHSQDPPASVRGELIDGDVSGFRGEWRFKDLGSERTQVECDMAIDPGRWVPKRIAKLLHETVLRRAVRDLKNYLED
jgi:ribosome-associated toxin RatA of RatAB toxin-antitoxin module